MADAKGHRFSRTALRVLGTSVAGCLGVVILVGVLLQFRAARDGVLRFAVNRVATALPGDLVVGVASWPALSDLELVQVEWRNGGSTLATADRIHVSVNLIELLKRDVVAHDLAVESASVNVPGILRAFADHPGKLVDRGSAEISDPLFPRSGSVPGLPSISVEGFSVTALNMVLPHGSVIDTVAVEGNLDVTRDGGPVVNLERLTASSRGEGWSVEHTELSLNPGRDIGGSSRGMLGPGWPYRLDLDGTLDGEFALTLLLGEEGAFMEPFGTEAQGQLAIIDSRLEAVEFTAEVELPAVEELATLPVLREVLSGWPRLGASRMTVDGAVGIRPDFKAGVHVVVHPGEWIEHAEARFEYAEDRLRIEALDLDLPDLSIDVEGRLGEELSATASASVTGVSWLEILDIELPADSVALALELSARGSSKAPQISARVTGELELAGTRIEEIDLRLDSSDLADQPIEAVLVARAYETWVNLGLSLSRLDRIEIDASPLAVTAARPVGDPEMPGSARVSFDPDAQHLRVENFQVLGDHGDVTLDASVTDFRNGEATLLARWDSPPRILDQFLGPGTVDSLAARWGKRGPFEASIRADFEGNARERRVDLRGDVVLPGPATLAHFLPAGVLVGDLGPLRSDFTIQLSVTDEGHSFEADLDPSRTEWIDSSQLHVQGGNGRLDLRDSHLEAMGVRFSAEGAQEDGVWAMDARLETVDSRLLQIVAPSVGSDAIWTLAADLDLGGTTEQPEVAASVEGGMATEVIAFERLRGDVSWGSRGLSVALEFPQGITAPVLMDSVSIDYQSANTGLHPFPGVLEMEAAGPRVELAQVLQIDRDPDWKVTGQTVRAEIPEGYLETERPFRVLFTEGDGVVVVEDLALSGSLGRVLAEGYAGPDSSDIRADLSLTVPQEPKGRFPVPGLWPERIEVEVTSEPNGDLVLSALARGLEVSGHENLSARVSLLAGREVTELDLVIDDGSTRFATADLRIPARFHVYPPGWSPREGSLSGTASLSNLHLAWDRLVPGTAPGQLLAVDGNLELSGTTRRPVMTSHLTARLPSHPRRPEYSMSLESRFDAAGRDGGADFSTLVAAARLERETSTVLTANLEFPINVLGPEGWADSARTIDLRIDGGPLLLEELSTLIPTDHILKGEMGFDLTAAGMLEAPELEGTLAVSNASIRVARGGNAAGSATISVSGTSRRPTVVGRVDVTDGVIRVPENSRNVLPHEGQTVLWEVRGLPPLAAIPEEARAADSREGTTVEPDIDVNIRVPGSLWVRGRSLDVELAGDMNLIYRDGSPVILGTLRTKGGRFVFLNRTFTPGRGEVTFFGDDDFNPSLDLPLTTRVEQYEILVRITGTTSEPQLELSSVPDLDPRDIMSVLTFGKPSAELDGDQLQLAAQQAAWAAAAWAAAEAGGSLAGPLGVDMLVYNPSGREGRSTVQVGRWLSPRALLKYEQALERGAAYFITLEYSLERMMRDLRLETLVGTRQSGGEVSWSRDY